jgi:hypothetical protein
MSEKANGKAEKEWLPAELAERLRWQQERLSEFRGRL